MTHRTSYEPSKRLAMRGIDTPADYFWDSFGESICNTPAGCTTIQSIDSPNAYSLSELLEMKEAREMQVAVGVTTGSPFTLYHEAFAIGCDTLQSLIDHLADLIAERRGK